MAKALPLELVPVLAAFFSAAPQPPRERIVRQETVYVQPQPTYTQQPTQTITVESPRLQRALREARDDLASEQNRRLALERELTVIRGRLADVERDNARLAKRNRGLQKQLDGFKIEKTDTKEKEADKPKSGFWY